ncbi:MAG TPA: glycosyltransferase, partial [Anaerolineales bacterium]|nr:glycosyltransferase [Anaerolineales bacterium]
FITAMAGFRPLLCMSWGFDLMEDAERGPLWRWATRYTLRRSSYFVSDAEVTRARAITFGMDPDRTSVFPWGVDLRRFRRPASSRAVGSGHKGATGSKGTGLVLLCNRSWEKRYGVDVLARAFVEVAPRLPGVSLILIGTGSQGEAIRRIIADGGQMDRVLLPGRVSPAEIHRWYHKADLFISPSHVDGSSVSLMEALASGTPVLVSNIPANCEWVTDGVNGWLFQDGDADDLAQRILSIAKQRRDRVRISRAGRKTAERRADWDRNFQVLLRSYEKAVAVGASL